jgi:hypothetical protein
MGRSSRSRWTDPRVHDEPIFAFTMGRNPHTAPDPRDKRIAEQERQIARLTARAERAEAIAEIQKKVAALLGRPFPNEES